MSKKGFMPHSRPWVARLRFPLRPNRPSHPPRESKSFLTNRKLAHFSFAPHIKTLIRVTPKSKHLRVIEHKAQAPTT